MYIPGLAGIRSKRPPPPVKVAGGRFPLRNLFSNHKPKLRCSHLSSLTARLQSTGSGCLHCPRAAPTQGVVSCTYEQCFKPYSLRRRYCQLPVSGRRMQRFLQFRLGCHGLPIATGRLAAKLWLVLAM